MLNFLCLVESLAKALPPTVMLYRKFCEVQGRYQKIKSLKGEEVGRISVTVSFEESDVLPLGSVYFLFWFILCFFFSSHFLMFTGSEMVNSLVA